MAHTNGLFGDVFIDREYIALKRLKFAVDLYNLTRECTGCARQLCASGCVSFKWIHPDLLAPTPLNMRKDIQAHSS